MDIPGRLTKRSRAALLQFPNAVVKRTGISMLDDAIDGADYKTIKAEFESRMLSLEAKFIKFAEPVYNLNVAAVKLV